MHAFFFRQNPWHNLPYIDGNLAFFDAHQNGSHFMIKIDSWMFHSLSDEEIYTSFINLQGNLEDVNPS